MDSALKKIILDFLQQRPHGVAANSFVRWCLAEIQYHLVCLRGARHRLPLDLTNPERSLENLAIDVAGFYFGEERADRYHKIFHNLEAHGFCEFREEDITEIMRLLRAQIVQFTNQRIFKFTRQEQPESGKCKKALEAALATLETRSEIVVTTHNGDRNKLIADATVIATNPQLPFIPFVELIEFIDKTYAQSLNKVQLCRLVLKSMAEQNQHQKHVLKHEFVAAVVVVLARRALFEAPLLSSLESPIQIILRREMENEIQATLIETTAKDLEEQVTKSRIRNDEVEPLLTAVEYFLLDCINGGPDKVTKYFYATMPVQVHSQFRSHYKYAFETVVTRSQDDLHRRIKRNPTIRKLWDYL